MLRPDPEPEKGFYYRSDHFNFASRACLRSIRTLAWSSSASPPTTARQKRDEWTEKDYHEPSDQVKPDWDLSGAAEDAKLLIAVGYRVAQRRQVAGMEAGQRVQGDTRRDVEEVTRVLGARARRERKISVRSSAGSQFGDPVRHSATVRKSAQSRTPSPVFP